MLKILKVPHGFSEAPYEQSVLQMNGFSVVESCLHTQQTEGTMFLENHMLLFVLKGQYKISFGEKTYKVNENEMVLFHKSIVIRYEKMGNEESEYLLDYMMFFLKDDLLNEFIKMYDFNQSFPSVVVPISVKPINKRLKGYIQSLKPLFNDSSGISNGLVKLKLLELLFDLVDTDEKLLVQFLQLKQKERRSITDVVDENLYNPVNVNDLAYLSGRSVSTFKREFKEIYNTSPLKWIRNRRLDKARELFSHTKYSVTEVCFSTGFENVAHFSKVFKERFGVSPSMFKQSVNLHKCNNYIHDI
jgi:AraC-like DNA-binding protein